MVTTADEAPKAESPALANDFDAAVTALRSSIPQARVPRSRIKEWGLAGPIGFEDYRQATLALAKVHGPAATPFLHGKLADRDRHTRRLALMTLAALADDQAAADVLAHAMLEEKAPAKEAMMAATYAPETFLQHLINKTLQRRPITPQAAAALAVLIRFFGSDDDAKTLEKLGEGLSIPRPPRNPLAGQPSGKLQLPRDTFAEMWWGNVDASLEAQRQRWARPPAERLTWLEQDLTVWRAVEGMPNLNRSQRTEVDQQAVAAADQIRFDSEYLSARLHSSHLGQIELMILIRIVALQRNTALIPTLAEIVDERRIGYGDAKDVLLSFGTRDALAPVERLIPPPAPPSILPADRTRMSESFEVASRGLMIQQLCEELARRGDRVTLELMSKLSSNTAYSPGERAIFAKARGALTARLGKNGITQSPQQISK